jgi:glycosyltransferase involved in cell wall biosynthesis
MSTPEPLARVALFSTHFLRYSQSFVFEELCGLRRYQAEVFCWRRHFADRFPFEPVHVANPAYVLTRSSPAFVRRFRAAPFALVHAHFGPGATYAEPYAQRFDLPLVVTFHGYDVPLLSSWQRLLPQHWPYALRAPAMLERMTLGLCASSELEQMLREQGVPASKLRVHRLGIDLRAFAISSKPAGPLEVIMIGRFVEKKGFEYGLRAFARALAKSGADAKLTLIGSGEREALLRAEVTRLGLERKVDFAGVLPKQAVAERLQRAHVLLAPSVVGRDGNRESGLIVVKEASACATVPIGTRHGGIPEIIDDRETGFLVEERDVDAMAERLASLFSDPPLRERLGRAARLKMEREYDNHARVQALEALYDEARALHAHSRRRPTFGGGRRNGP